MLDRLLQTPHLERVVPRIEPDELHRIIRSCGLADCGELLVAATAEQLTRIFDLDLWRSPQPGMDEEFDADRFGEWLETLAEFGGSTAARKLAELDPAVVIAGIARHVRVFDLAVVSGIPERDGELACDIGGYRVVAKRPDSWESIVTILIALDAEHQDCFHRVMRGCRSLSNAGFEIDGLDHLFTAERQNIFEFAMDRETRREKQGYVPPGQARAFLEASRQLSLKPDVTQPAEAVAPSHPLHFIRTHMQTAFDDAAADARGRDELTYLANTLIAGCAVQGRPFTTPEAADAALAICNLGLENWSRLPTPAAPRSLVTAFQVGWTILHHDVGMFTAARLAEVLGALPCEDPSIHDDLLALRTDLLSCCQAGTPWRARNALDVITMLDTPAWAVLDGVLGECPVLHAALSAAPHAGGRAVHVSDFELISANSQIRSIHEFLLSLPDILGRL